MVPASSHWMTKYCNTSSYIVTAPKKMYRYFDGNSQHQPENKTTNGEEMMAKALIMYYYAFGHNCETLAYRSAD
jgi:hypothetical protein